MTPQTKHRMLPYFRTRPCKLLEMFHLGKRVQDPATSGTANPSDTSSHHANVAYNVVDLSQIWVRQAVEVRYFLYNLVP